MAAIKRSALGRGLDALITMEDLKTGGSSSISEISLSKIQPNPDQPRSMFEEEALEELATSIRSLGVIQPITLKEIGPDRYMIISGERRYRASLKAGLEEIPAYIKTAADEHVVEMALIENIQREDLNAIEIALAYQKLIDNYELTQEKLSERVGYGTCQSTDLCTGSRNSAGSVRTDIAGWIVCPPGGRACAQCRRSSSSRSKG